MIGKVENSKRNLLVVRTVDVEPVPKTNRFDHIFQSRINPYGLYLCLNKKKHYWYIAISTTESFSSFLSLKLKLKYERLRLVVVWVVLKLQRSFDSSDISKQSAYPSQTRVSLRHIPSGSCLLMSQTKPEHGGGVAKTKTIHHS